MLWEAWEKEQRPKPAPAAPARARSRRARRRASRRHAAAAGTAPTPRQPAAAAAPAAAPPPRARRSRVTHRPDGRRDRYPGRHAQAPRAAQAQGLGRSDQELRAARSGAPLRGAERPDAAKAGRTIARCGRASASECCARSRARTRVEVRLQRAGPRRRQRREGLYLQARQLRHRRRARDPQPAARQPVDALRLLPADARRQAASNVNSVAETFGAQSFTGFAVYTAEKAFEKVHPTRPGQGEVRAPRRQTAGSPSCSTTSSRPGCRRTRLGARLRRAEAQRRPVRRQRGGAAPARSRRAAQRQVKASALRRPAGAAAAAGGRAGPRPGGRLRLAHDHRLAAVLAAGEVPRAVRQLGRRHHPAHGADQDRVLPALGGELQVDGEDEADHAAADQAARDVRRTTGRR